jgi:outer membrane protein assembly factor BamD (BamD/ComL family)
MEVYARLNTIRLNKGSDPKIIDENIASLVAMAKKDRYYNYRDIIYYAAALFEMERNGYDNATGFLKKSIQYNENNLPQKSKSFMLLANIEFAQKKYAPSAPLYDSVDASVLPDESVVLLDQRKPGTHHIYEAHQVIYLQDSLLALAHLEEAKRIDFVKQLSRKLRKERGLQEEAISTGTGNAPLMSASSQNAQPANLFTPAGSSWYFYDVNIRANGFTKFKERWGGRQNQDNWRRSAALAMGNPQNTPSRDVDAALGVDSAGIGGNEDGFDSTDITFDNLYSRIPLSEESIIKANNRIDNALYKEGMALFEELEDYEEAIKVFEKLLARQDSGDLAQKSLFALVYCYTKVGDAAIAARCRQLLQNNFGGTELSDRLDKKKTSADDLKIKEATDLYKKIYDLFLEGNFDQAMSEKGKADSLFGNNFWTPQLLYIESVYHIRQRDDSLAILTLKNIETQFPESGLAPKAKKIIEVLGKRKEIEEYLTKLEVTRAKEDEVVVIREPVRVRPANIPASDSVLRPTQVVTMPKTDTVAAVITATPTQVSPYLINPNEPAIVALVLEKVDPAYVNEVLYSFNSSSRKNFNGNAVEASKLKLRDGLWLLLLKSASLKDAVSSLEYI